ncbi:hypothetical protein Mapa_016108 [Marchantia paleacea]|nr:hypothetical protein Mapa_016108 [Marchantia paleacea]
MRVCARTSQDKSNCKNAKTWVQLATQPWTEPKQSTSDRNKAHEQYVGISALPEPQLPFAFSSRTCNVVIKYIRWYIFYNNVASTPRSILPSEMITYPTTFDRSLKKNRPIKHIPRGHA